MVKSRSNVKNNRTTGIASSYGNMQVSLYPQPATNEVLVNFGSVQSKTSLELYNALGELVLKEAAQNTQTLTLNLQNLSKGVYSLILTNETGKTVKKLVKD